jgi:hypothetical protein
MSQKILEKTSTDNRVFDLDMSDLLDSAETISAIGSVTDDDMALTFGTAAVNPSPVTYPDGTTAATGKVVQVKIGGGSASHGKNYIVRANVTTSHGNTIQAVAQLRVDDTP